LKKESIRKYHGAEIYREKYTLKLSMLETLEYNILNMYTSIHS